VFGNDVRDDTQLLEDMKLVPPGRIVGWKKLIISLQRAIARLDISGPAISALKIPKRDRNFGLYSIKNRSPFSCGGSIGTTSDQSQSVKTDDIQVNEDKHATFPCPLCSPDIFGSPDERRTQLTAAEMTALTQKSMLFLHCDFL
jgi:hypothetical protein